MGVLRHGIGPIAGKFPILSLRTNKADVIVAVDEEVAKKLDESGEKWRYNGKCVSALTILNMHTHETCDEGMRLCCSSLKQARRIQCVICGVVVEHSAIPVTNEVAPISIC